MDIENIARNKIVQINNSNDYKRELIRLFSAKNESSSMNVVIQNVLKVNSTNIFHEVNCVTPVNNISNANEVPVVEKIECPLYVRISNLNNESRFFLITKVNKDNFNDKNQKVRLDLNGEIKVASKENINQIIDFTKNAFNKFPNNFNVMSHGNYDTKDSIGTATVSFTKTGKIKFIENIVFKTDISEKEITIVTDSVVKRIRKSCINNIPVYKAKIIDHKINAPKIIDDDFVPSHKNDHKFTSVINKISDCISKFTVRKDSIIFVNDFLLNRLNYNFRCNSILENTDFLGRIVECAVAHKGPKGLGWVNQHTEYKRKFDYSLNGTTMDIKGTIDITKGAPNKDFNKGIFLKKEKILSNNLAEVILLFSVWEDEDTFYFNFRGWISRECLKDRMSNFRNGTEPDGHFISYNSKIDNYRISMNALTKV